MRRNTYLAHHGIKGQRWGVKNGPPYPLDANRHNVQERTLNGTKKTKIRSVNAKKLIAAGAITAGVLLAGYGAYRLSKISPGIAGLAGAAKPPRGYNEAFSAKKQISLLDHFRGIKKSDKEMDFDPSQLDPSFRHKDRYMSKKEDVDAINGALGNVNPFRTVNCTICTTAYEMRRRGYDVKANSLLNGGGPKSLWNVCDFFKDASINDWGFLSNSYIDKDESECRRAVKKELMAMGKGARGNFFTHLNTDLTTMCHSVIFEVDDNDVHFIDAQTKKWYTYEEGIKMFKTRPGGLWDNTTGSFWLRTDDKELNFDVLKHFVSDVGGKTKRSETGRSSKREMLSKAAGAAKTVVRKVRSSEPARKYTSTIDNARLQGSLARMEIRDIANSGTRTAENLARSSDALRNARSAVNNASRQVRSSNTIQTARSAVDNARLQGSLAKMELRDKFNR